jgi:hypothetical protein
MKRTLAVVLLLTALGVLCKLAWKGRDGVSPSGVSSGSGSSQAVPAATRDEAALALKVRYPSDHELIDRVLDAYHHNALAIEGTDGLRGLVLLDRLGLEAVFLYEKYPREFRRLREALTDQAAADILLHWREYFALKRAEDADRGTMISEIARLGPAARRAAAKYPNALPLILAEPVGVVELMERYRDDPDDLRDALVALDFVSLESGAADLRAALRVFDEHGPLALEAFRHMGPEGLALVKLYGPVLEAVGDAMPLDDALLVLRVNTDDVDAMLASHTPETVAGHLRHAAAANLVPVVGGGPHALRLAVEFGTAGDQALRAAGPDAADVVYDEYDEPILRDRAVAALAEHGPMALAILSKYAPDAAFRDILQKYGPRVIEPIAQSDPAPENLAALRAKQDKGFKEILLQGLLAVSRDSGQATIKLIQKDGIERVESLASTDMAFYQFLPLYDLIHLGRVVGRGQTPTGGELTWALVDAGFVVADVLSLTALQPEGAAAVEAARAEVKAMAGQAARKAGRELTEEAGAVGSKVAAQGAEATAERLAKWWTVRLVGGTFQVMRRLPEAVGRMGLADLSRLAQPLARKAGLRLTTWKPMRFLLRGETVLRSIPLDRGLKYVGAQALQAGVGVVAIHKMEEHLASRRPDER